MADDGAERAASQENNNYSNDANAADDDEDEVTSTGTNATLPLEGSESLENEETIHERRYRERRLRQQEEDRINSLHHRQLERQEGAARLAEAVARESPPPNQPIGHSHQQAQQQQHHHHRSKDQNNEHKHHHHHNHDHHHHHHHRKHSSNHQAHGHTKEMIKPDPTVRRARSTAVMSPGVHVSSKSPGRLTTVIAAGSISRGSVGSPSGAVKQAPLSRPVATAVDEEQLHRRLMQSVSDKRLKSTAKLPHNGQQLSQHQQQTKTTATTTTGATKASMSKAAKGVQQAAGSFKRPVASEDLHSDSHSSSRSSASKSSSSNGVRASRNNNNNGPANTTGFQVTDDMSRSPPPATIIIPANVARSLSMKAAQGSNSRADPRSPDSVGSVITREQLDYGPLLKSNEVQVLYRSPETIESPTGLDRHLKEEQAKQVSPHLKQSPIAIMSINPAYELHNKPLTIEYPATVENLRLNNTGFSWEVKIPYQISMTTALHGAHLNQAHRFRLDQFHCHWGENVDKGGSEHTVDNRSYSAEMHFVHYNMEKYHTLSKAARHSDGLVVLSVFIDARADHHNHAELDKIVSQLKSIQLKGEHTIIKQAVRIENLLPTNRSYWSYQGSLTTPPYLESVTWFVLKYPIRCNTAQIEKFKSLSSSVRRDDEPVSIKSNFRKTQPLNGRSIVSYDEPMGGPKTRRDV